MHGSTPHDHDHGPTEGHEKRLGLAAGLLLVVCVVVAVGGIISGSLALVSDAGHILLDAASLLLALFGVFMAKKPQDALRNYGYHRLEVLAAFVNGLTLIFVFIWIFGEAIIRMFRPEEINTKMMFIIAFIGCMANVVAFFILRTGSSTNINIQSALLHLWGDLLVSVAAMIAAVAIWKTGIVQIDPILSIVASAMILRGGMKIVMQAGHVLMQGSPEDLDVTEMVADLKASVPEIEDIHDVKLWSLTPEKPMMTMHVVISKKADQKKVMPRIKTILHDEYGMYHSVIQIENDICDEVN